MSQNGKGSRPRKVNYKKYAENYDSIFRGRASMNIRPTIFDPENYSEDAAREVTVNNTDCRNLTLDSIWSANGWKV